MRKPFTHAAVFVLALVALVQLLRLVLGWDVVHGHAIPMWFSLVALVVAGGLSVTVWRENSGGRR